MIGFFVIFIIPAMFAAELEVTKECREIAETSLGRRMDNYYITVVGQDEGVYENEDFHLLQYMNTERGKNRKILYAKSAAGMGAIILEDVDIECFEPEELVVWILKAEQARFGHEVEESFQKLLVPIKSRFQDYYFVIFGAIGFIVGEIAFAGVLTLLIRRAKNGLKSFSSG